MRNGELTLLLRSKRDHAFLPVFVEADKPITRLIILGLVLLTISGVGWLLLGYPFTPLLVVKLALVGAIWILGPVIDNVLRRPPAIMTLLTTVAIGGDALVTPPNQILPSNRSTPVALVVGVVFLLGRAPGRSGLEPRHDTD